MPLGKHPNSVPYSVSPLLDENAELLPVALRKEKDIPCDFYAYIVLSR
jgi:hypothetical protein